LSLGTEKRLSGLNLDGVAAPIIDPTSPPQGVTVNENNISIRVP